MHIMHMCTGIVLCMHEHTVAIKIHITSMHMYITIHELVIYPSFLHLLFMKLLHVLGVAELVRPVSHQLYTKRSKTDSTRHTQTSISKNTLISRNS